MTQRRGLPTDVFRRGKSVLGLAAGLAGRELRHQLRARLGGSDSSDETAGGNASRMSSELRTRIEQAKLLVDSLGRLKGALMKAGQLLSIDGSDYLPPEVLEVLSKLQGQSEPVDSRVIVKVIRDELGDAGFERLVEFSLDPAASASIGQVHRATVDGHSVAVKV